MRRAGDDSARRSHGGARVQSYLFSVQRPVVMIVLDDSERSALLKLSLVSRGWDVVRAHSCEQARVRMREQPVDAVLTDLALSDGSAFGLLRSLTPRPAVAAVLTWSKRHGFADRIVTAGFDLQLERPIDATRVDQAMRDCLATKVASHCSDLA
jgi:DNA-binding response OmpR family regulator